MTSTKRRDTIPGTPSSIRATRQSEVRGKAIQTSYEAPEAKRPSGEAPTASDREDEDERITVPVPATVPAAAVPSAERRPDPRREED